ncbi:MAG: hypothetical protein DMD91_11325 [Candidatus Rokuibacteriota bacterium]|nr:MAG: hypothetical protein DMD91_11325 [Candidatus Rokubacteria bacterium]
MKTVGLDPTLAYAIGRAFNSRCDVDDPLVGQKIEAVFTREAFVHPELHLPLARLSSHSVHAQTPGVARPILIVAVVEPIDKSSGRVDPANLDVELLLLIHESIQKHDTRITLRVEPSVP